MVALVAVLDTVIAGLKFLGFNKRGMLVYRGRVVRVTRPFAAVLVTDCAPWR